MQIKTYKPIEYKGYAIYFRHYLRYFEYLAVLKGEIYTRHIEVKPTFINYLLYWLKWQDLYSYQQELNILKVLEKVAKETIDQLTKTKNK